jgi:exodeoxyribonuclease VII large subunit
MEPQTPITVSQLNLQVKTLLDASLPPQWIEGEISNFACPASGHWYFSLKDERAQIRCAMFRGNNSRINFTPESGQQVLVRGKVSLYAPRGDYQLVVDHMEEAGVGALQRAFEQLKNKLLKEGLFEETHKKALPDIPTCVGVVTSDTGAAIRDILSVLERRFPLLNVIIYPTLVQGDKAAAQIAKAINTANDRQECDVLIVSRGGGSLEDLWPFNEEVVARAMFDCDIPIVAGVGHEVDFTICDFVADYRAPTPSAAAETISPDQEELLQTLDDYEESFVANIHDYVDDLSQQLDYLFQRLQQQHPVKQLENQHVLLERLARALSTAQSRLLENRQAQFSELARALNAVSPLATLDRGYAVASKNNKILYKSSDLKLNDQLQLRLSKGEIHCSVDEILA